MNSFHESTLRDEQADELVSRLEARLRTVESSAVEVHGRNEELSHTTAQIRSAELNAASYARLMHNQAQQEVLAAQNLRTEMAQVQTVTDRLRGDLSHLESESRLGEQERQSALARRTALDQQALQMRNVFFGT